MNIKDVPIYDLWFFFPADIKAILIAIFAFLVGLAVWRIIK